MSAVRRGPGYGAAASAGVLAALSFPQGAPGTGTELLPREILALAAPALLARLSASSLSAAQAQRRAWAAGVAFFAVLIRWLTVPMEVFGGLPWWQARPFLALLVAFCALFWSVVPGCTRRLVAMGLPPPAALAAAVVACEWLRGDVVGFPWGAWAYGQARNLPLAQLAQLGGAPLVSAWVAGLGALLAAGRGAWRSPTAAVLAAGLLLGGGLLARPLAGTPAPPIGLVQGNIHQTIKNQPAGHLAEVVEVHQALTRQARALGAEMVLWPETALPFSVHAGEAWPPSLRLGVAGLLGCSVFDDATGALTNSALWVEADGAVVGRYDKHHLVPFGEYVPLRRWLPIDRLVPGTVDITPGRSIHPIGPEGAWGPLICYDGVFAQVSRRQVRQGAQVLANITNDGWYGHTGGPYQHRDFYVLRAIETGRWVARASNPGVSAFVDPHGRLHQPTALGERTVAVGHVQLRRQQTVYTRLGDWAVALAVGLCLAAWLPRRRR